MFDSHDTWNAIYNRSNLWMQNTMKLRHLCSIVATHEASFTMRGATGVTHQCRQLLCLPRKMTTLMIDPCHMWNVIYNGRSNRQNPPTSPNIASAHSKIWQKFVKTAETWFTVRGRAEHDPRMIRPWAQSAIRSATEVTFRARHEHFVLKEKDFPLRLSFQISPAPATKSDSWTSPSIASANKSDTVTLLNYYLTELISITWLNCYCALLNYSLTELLLFWTIAWMNYDLTELLMTEPLLDWIISWLNYYLTKLLLDWTMIWLNYYMAEPLLDWIITWLNYFLTELLLDWTMIWLNCYMTEPWLNYYLAELLLDWINTWLN